MATRNHCSLRAMGTSGLALSLPGFISYRASYCSAQEGPIWEERTFSVVNLSSALGWHCLFTVWRWQRWRLSRNGEHSSLEAEKHLEKTFVQCPSAICVHVSKMRVRVPGDDKMIVHVYWVPGTVPSVSDTLTHTLTSCATAVREVPCCPQFTDEWWGGVL